MTDRTETKSKIETSVVLSAASLAMTIVMAAIHFGGANDSRLDAMASRVCRIEAVMSVGDCKR
jgi:hypothetical protein